MLSALGHHFKSPIVFIVMIYLKNVYLDRDIISK